jgi:hypothetical protein
VESSALQESPAARSVVHRQARWTAEAPPEQGLAARRRAQAGASLTAQVGASGLGSDPPASAPDRADSAMECSAQAPHSSVLWDNQLHAALFRRLGRRPAGSTAYSGTASEARAVVAGPLEIIIDCFRDIRQAFEIRGSGNHIATPAVEPIEDQRIVKAG